MKFFKDNPYLNWGITGFLVAAASMLFYFGIFHMNIIIDGISIVLQILMPLIYGAVIAYLLNPVLNFLEKKSDLPPSGFQKPQSGKEEQKADSLFLYPVSCLLTVLAGIFSFDDHSAGDFK